jgi:hypothetical protein
MATMATAAMIATSQLLEDLFSQAKAMRRMAMSEPGQILTHFEAVDL